VNEFVVGIIVCAQTIQMRNMMQQNVFRNVRRSKFVLAQFREDRSTIRDKQFVVRTLLVVAHPFAKKQRKTRMAEDKPPRCSVSQDKPR
jgi:hypothetical protein